MRLHPHPIGRCNKLYEECEVKDHGGNTKDLQWDLGVVLRGDPEAQSCDEAHEDGDCNGEEPKFNFIPRNLLRKLWMRLVVNNLCKADISHEQKILLHFMKDKYPYGFITDVGTRSMRRVEMIRYLARYMRHPAIANRRIIFYGRGLMDLKIIIGNYYIRQVEQMLKNLSGKRRNNLRE